MTDFTHTDVYDDAMKLFMNGPYFSLMQAVLDVMRSKRYILSLNMPVVLNVENILPEPETTTPDKR